VTPAATQDPRLPAEWEPHEATWIAWPWNVANWPGVHEEVIDSWIRIIEALRRFEEVRLLVNGRAEAEAVRKRAASGGEHALRLVEVPTNDVWVRDYGPIFTWRASGGLTALVFRFNAWGGKYPPWDDDAAAGLRIAEAAQVPAAPVDAVLEGGSIDSNGAGTLLTTESCLLSPDRNPQLDRGGIEALLNKHLGARKVLWLGGSIAGDDTDGHIDQLCRFVGPHRVVAAVEQDPADPSHRPLEENLERLRGATDQDGRRLEVIPLPLPEPVFHRGQRLPASYANFYVANGAVLVPTFRSRRDAAALGVFRELFPDREVVGLDSVAVVAGLGALHCLTKEQPASLSAEKAASTPARPALS
jgi:agmatine deiminase